MRHIFCIILAINLYSTVCKSASIEVYPAKCVPFSIQGVLLDLKVKPPAVVMLHNLSKNDLWLTHNAVGEESSGWSNRLSANKWSALSMTKESLNISCIESRPGHEQNIACSDALAVCIWPAEKIPKQSLGVVWAGENRSLSTLIAYIARRGYVVKSE